RELRRVPLRHLLHVGVVPGVVAVALGRVPHIAIGERLHAGALARERPLGLGAEPLAHSGALHLGLVESIHHLRPLTLLVGPLVGVDAIALVRLLADAAGGAILERFADRLLVGFVEPALQAGVLDLAAVVALDDLHVGGAGERAGRRLGRAGV